MPDTPSDTAHQIHEHQRQTKRRKLTHNKEPPNYSPIKYGWNGQVDPGHLQLEIVSSDGGEYPPGLGTSFTAENVLRDNNEVYCSSSSKCNLLFRHQAETTFHLDALAVKGPALGFTAPIQQGLVFVGMSKDELLTSSEAYRMEYNGTKTCPHVNSARERLTFLESLDDPDTLRAYESRIRYQTALLDADEFQNAADSNDEGDSSYGNDCDFPTPEVESAAQTSELTTAPTPPPFTVTADDDSEEEEWFPDSYHDLETDTEAEQDLEPEVRQMRRQERQEIVEQRRQRSRERFLRTRRMRNISNSELRPRGRNEIRPARRSIPSRIEARKTAGKDILSPSARFFIGPNKSKITIKFPAPV
jgi:hypothetical protein